jgi:UDP-glucuronate decarboxylase
MIDIILTDAEKTIKKCDFSWLNEKTILVTGATGLLGTHFLATLTLLKEQGMKIKVFGVCHSDPADYTKEIACRGDIHLVDDVPFSGDAIIHLSGYAQPAVFTANPAETIRINTTLTQRLLNQLLTGGKFLFASSSEVYSGLSGTVKESDIGTTSPSHPRACYIEGKRCGETIVNAYRSMGVDAKSARLGLTYGPGVRKDDKRAMSTFIDQALTKGKIRMEYPGLELRSYCYVQDAVETLWNILLHGIYPVYNVGGPSAVSIASLAASIGQIVGVETVFPKTNKEMAGADGVLMDSSRAEREFGKKDYVGFQEGLERTIDWHRGL